MRKITRKVAFSGIATVGIVAMLAGCAAAPDAPSESSAAAGNSANIQPCMVSDAGGFDDRSFNQLSFEGMNAAADQLGVKARSVESNAATDYAPNLTTLIDQGCSLIVTVGYSLSEGTATAAKANPNLEFTIVDDNAIDLPNVKPLVYDTAQAAFLAGYAAAATSKTGKIATWGGTKIPSVTIFMDGFVDGAKYYNQQKSASVQVLGWDVDKQDGSFVGSFNAGPEAKTTAQSFIDQGADILLPVGGPIFLSAAEAIRDQQTANPANKIALIGVDADLTKSSPENADLFLTSIMKDMSGTVKKVVLDAANGDFSNQPYIGTLENEGVGIAPFYGYESSVPTDLQSELDTIKTGIISGDIAVASPSSPK